MKRIRPFILLVLLFSSFSLTHAQSSDWWLAGSTIKVIPDLPQPADITQPLHLHAARLEYAPFQIVIATDGSADATLPAPMVDFSTEYFTLQLFEEYFIDINLPPDSVEIFSQARLTTTATIPDGLRPLGESLTVPAQNRNAVVWVDVYVNAGTPAGDYTLTVTLPGVDTRTVTITVYDLDLAPSAAMSVILPLDYSETPQFYAPDNEEVFHRDVNALLLEHDLTLGTLTGFPEFNGSWDFSMFDAQVDAMPPGSNFYVPNPYRNDWEEYLFEDQNGDAYTVTDFSDSYFVEQLTRYYTELAAYLRAHNRLDGALAYPFDETRWVADEPDHNGPEGYIHLSQWTAIIRVAGMRVTSSRVAPAPIYSADWLPTEQLADDTHVHIDLFDADPELFQHWESAPGRTASVYLNSYGDLIDMPAAIHRGVLWHSYARGVRMVAGYSTMDWVDARYNFLDPWTQQADLHPIYGYGAGALVYPGPLPSIRLKIIREGIEDARLLDAYAGAAGIDAARAFAACLTPGALADQNPSPDLWDNAHAALLIALRNGTPVDQSLCQPTVIFASDQQVVFNADSSDALGEWGLDLVEGEVVQSPFADSGEALQLIFGGGSGVAEIWLGGRDWSEWDTLLLDVANASPTFVELDVAIGDETGNYLLLRNGALILGPQRQTTLMLPLVVPYGSESTQFDWSTVQYIDLESGTSLETVDGFDEEQVYDLTPHTLIVDNIRLARIER